MGLILLTDGDTDLGSVMMTDLRMAPDYMGTFTFSSDLGKK